MLLQGHSIKTLTLLKQAKTKVSCWRTNSILDYRLLHLSSQNRSNKYYIQHANLMPTHVRTRDKRTKASTQLALEYFDTFYKPIYGDLWPGIRVSLLTRMKDCALVNNFYQKEKSEDVRADLISFGADDLYHGIIDYTIVRDAEIDQQRQLLKDILMTTKLHKDDPEGYDYMPDLSASEGHDLSYFVPPTPVRSDIEQLRHTELQEGVAMFEDQGRHAYNDLEIEVIHEEILNYPQHLRVHTAQQGDVIDLPEQEIDSANQKSFEYIDASFILPVLSLGIQPSERILHLGDVSKDIVLTIINTMLTDKITILSNNYQQRKELLEDLKGVTLPSHWGDDEINIKKGEPLKYLSQLECSHERVYDKIIIHAPSFADRHYLHEEEDNLFSKNRIDDRLKIPAQQQQLLVHSLNALISQGGGTVVYCVSTLSPAQGDSVVYSAINEIQQTSKAKVKVANQSYLAEKLRSVFKFSRTQSYCHLGQLVLPNLLANFSPMYFCRMDIDKED